MRRQAVRLFTDGQYAEADQLLAELAEHGSQQVTEQAEQLLERYWQDSGELPESIAMVLWGSDNLKTEGGPIAQALHLMGAKPTTDSYGRLSGAERGWPLLRGYRLGLGDRRHPPGQRDDGR